MDAPSQPAPQDAKVFSPAHPSQDYLQDFAIKFLASHMATGASPVMLTLLQGLPNANFQNWDEVKALTATISEEYIAQEKKIVTQVMAHGERTTAFMESLSNTILEDNSSLLSDLRKIKNQILPSANTKIWKDRTDQATELCNEARALFATTKEGLEMLPLLHNAYIHQHLLRNEVRPYQSLVDDEEIVKRAEDTSREKYQDHLKALRSASALGERTKMSHFHLSNELSTAWPLLPALFQEAPEATQHTYDNVQRKINGQAPLPSNSPVVDFIVHAKELVNQTNKQFFPERHQDDAAHFSMDLESAAAKIAQKRAQEQLALAAVSPKAPRAVS